MAPGLRQRNSCVGRINGFQAPGEGGRLITDEYQGLGPCTELSRRLMEIARAEKIERAIAEILFENLDMQRVCRELGFRMQLLSR